MGAKLKKVQTVDKSGPLISGRVAGSNAAATSSPVKSAGSSYGGGATTANGGSAPKLAGLFGGMTAMPKLKPVGGRGMFFFSFVFLNR